MSFYSEMAQVVTDILSDVDFKQGSVYLVRVTKAAANIATPWIPGTESTSFIELDSVTRRVDQKYVDGVEILATDDAVTFAVPNVEPSNLDRIQKDGILFNIKRLIRIPDAGTPVAYMAIIGTGPNK